MIYNMIRHVHFGPNHKGQRTKYAYNWLINMYSLWTAFLFKHPVFQTRKIYAKFPRFEFSTALSAVFIEVFLVFLSLLRKCWECTFKYCTRASNYQLTDYENPTTKFHGTCATANHSGDNEDSGLLPYDAVSVAEQWCFVATYVSGLLSP